MTPDSIGGLDGIGKQVSQWELEMEAEREVEEALEKQKKKERGIRGSELSCARSRRWMVSCLEKSSSSSDSKLRNLRSKFGLEPSPAATPSEEDSPGSSSSGSDLEIEDVAESKPVKKELFHGIPSAAEVRDHSECPPY